MKQELRVLVFQEEPNRTKLQKGTYFLTTLKSIDYTDTFDLVPTKFFILQRYIEVTLFSEIIFRRGINQILIKIFYYGIKLNSKSRNGIYQ